MPQGTAATWGGSSVLMVWAGVAAGAGRIASLFWSQTSFQMLTLSLARVGHWVYLSVVEGWILHFVVWLFDMGPQQTVS